jgi:hypothetical protein
MSLRRTTKTGMRAPSFAATKTRSDSIADVSTGGSSRHSSFQSSDLPSTAYSDRGDVNDVIGA